MKILRTHGCRGVVYAVVAIVVLSSASGVSAQVRTADPVRWQLGVGAGPTRGGTSTESVPMGIAVTGSLERRFPDIWSVRADVGRSRWTFVAPTGSREVVNVRRVTVGVSRRLEGFTDGFLQAYFHGGAGIYAFEVRGRSNTDALRAGVHGAFGFELGPPRLPFAWEISLSAVPGPVGSVRDDVLFTVAATFGLKARF